MLTPSDETLNIYKVVSLASPDGREVLACASRRSGFAVMPVAQVGPESFGKRLRPAGVDFVDVTALGVDGYPMAAAALGLDCSIHFVRDVLSDRNSKTLHYNVVGEGERAYRILCAEGHVFLLTNRRLYAFVDLAARFLEGEAIQQTILVRGLDLDAVDVSLALDRSLLVVMPDSVYRIGIDSLVASGGGRNDRSLVSSPSGVSAELRPDRTGDGTWESLGDSPWKPSEEIPLSAVA